MTTLKVHSCKLFILYVFYLTNGLKIAHAAWKLCFCMSQSDFMFSTLFQTQSAQLHYYEFYITECTTVLVPYTNEIIYFEVC